MTSIHATPRPELPSVTVVIPCYNREDSVEAAVRSVLDQEYGGDLTVIAVDDASTDKTRDVLASIVDSRLRIMNNTGPKGACGSRNTGAFAGDGTWIAFQDSDDLWLPGKLAAQMDRALGWTGARACVAVYCGMEIRAGTEADSPVIDRIPNDERPATEGDIMDVLVRTSLISTQTLVVRRDVFEAANGFDEHMPALQDWDLMLRVAPQGDVALVETPLVTQRMSGNSITKSSPKRVQAQVRLLENHTEIWHRYPKAQAHHFYRIAGGYRRLDQMSEAQTAATKAVRLRPSNLKYRAMWLYLTLKTLRSRS